MNLKTHTQITEGTAVIAHQLIEAVAGVRFIDELFEVFIGGASMWVIGEFTEVDGQRAGTISQLYVEDEPTGREYLTHEHKRRAREAKHLLANTGSPLYVSAILTPEVWQQVGNDG